MKWKYLTVLMMVYYQNTSREFGYINRVYINNQPASEWDRKPLHEILNNLGDQDWELVSVKEIGSISIFIFKRPVSS